MKKPIVIMIRDGWGYREKEEYNGPFQGRTPFTNFLMDRYPNVLLHANGEHVGLPSGFIGNSEVGHMTIGTGRVIDESLVKINKLIANGSFFENQTLIDAIHHSKHFSSTLHLMGLLQDEGVHADTKHLIALLELCKKFDHEDVVIHLFTDGRDSLVYGAREKLVVLQKEIARIGIGKIVTISGRYYAMDRDKRWERTEKAYDAIVFGVGKRFENENDYLEYAYANEETDEFILPGVKKGYCGISKDDTVIFYNYRTDRPRQLTQAIVEERFEGWKRNPLHIHFVAMTRYYNPMNPRVHVAFEREPITHTLGEVLSEFKKRQLRITETEKYAHVTFFFNGQIETPYPGEDRILIDSPKVATYDLKPEMSVYEIGEILLEHLEQDVYDVIIVNFVNGDMVGHTGNWQAVLKAVEAVDKNVEKVINKVLDKDGVCLVFADHGNCEEMDGEHTSSHTSNPVPFILVSNNEYKLKQNKGLKDIAPTVLDLLDIDIPPEMTGESIIEKEEKRNN